MNYNNVNVFQGTGRSVMPTDDGLFSRWYLLKGKAGNVSPGACLPFSNVSCAPYSGGYSSGYGSLVRNWGDYVESFFEGDKLIGFAHFTHSGSGAFGFYYNYLVTIPYTGELSDALKLKSIDSESACPGYYTCRFTENNIKCEVTVSDKTAHHRYTSDTHLKIAVDISNDGLQQDDDAVYAYSSESEISILDNNTVTGYVTMQGVKLYYCIKCMDNAENCSLWLDKAEISDKNIHLDKTDKKFGCVFETDSDTVNIKTGFSLVSAEKARNSAEDAPEFDTAKNAARRIWEEKLSAIELYGISDEEREIFYSNFYHSLTKPCGWKGESFLWNEDDVFYHDFATLWDVYKTEIPLIFTLNKEVGQGIVNTIIRFAKEKGNLFNALMLSSNMNIEAKQACCLACYVLYDAYIRGLVDDVDGMFAAVRAEISVYESDILNGTMEKTTKLLDASLIAEAFADVAESLGRSDDHEYFSKLGNYWVDAFGEDGLLKTEYPYYEGNHWNYSFRFVNDVQKRIELSGGKDNLTRQLDGFFAFSDNNQLSDRFEGFNNETDMETPYFYHYVDRYDRLIDILDECVNTCFKSGREGLPGNNDSGGLSACFIWNYLGIFPISGQDAFFVGYPRAEKAVLHLQNGNDLTIKAEGRGRTIDKITFNGEVLDSYKIPASEIMNGGELVFCKK